MKLFVDTWGWLVLADRKDPLHDRAVQCYEKCSGLGGRVFTSNFVLDEAFTILFNRRPFDEARRFAKAILDSRSITVEVVTETRFGKAFTLRCRFSDKPRISFTDLTSMAIMTELKLMHVLTADAHFAQVGLGFQILPDRLGERVG